MKEDTSSSSIPGSGDIINFQLDSGDIELNQMGGDEISALSVPIDPEHLLQNTIDSKISQSRNLSWPSLWKNGHRRSAFLPYKPSRESASSSTAGPSADHASAEPRPSSTTVMTNVQRGNVQAQASSVSSTMSWFLLAGRGDVTQEQIDEVIAQGKDVDCVDEEGLSGLMWAVFHGQIHTVQLLLETPGVHVDRQGQWGETALMLAATEGHFEILRLLINAGAKINHEDHNRSTALMCAVYGDHPHSVSELLINGADLWVHNLNNFTAYDIAVHRKAHKAKAVLEKFICSLITGS